MQWGREKTANAAARHGGHGGQPPVLLVALPATAQDFQKGMAAAQRGDYAIAQFAEAHRLTREWKPKKEGK